MYVAWNLCTSLVFLEWFAFPKSIIYYFEGGGGIQGYVTYLFANTILARQCLLCCAICFEVLSEWVLKERQSVFHELWRNQIVLLRSPFENDWGPAEIWTRITGFRVQSANHYTMGPILETKQFSINLKLICFDAISNAFPLFRNQNCIEVYI